MDGPDLRLGGPSPDGDRLVDRVGPAPVLSSTVVHDGAVWDVHRDVVDLGAAGTVTREYVCHPGAVAVVALDESERILLIQQYRHPIGTTEWEIPAGLLDVAGEPPATTAARELAEEADLRAEHWSVLLDYASSPGGLSEHLRIFLARGLTSVEPHERHQRLGEEQAMPRVWLELDRARELVLSGRVRNATLILAVLVTLARRDSGWVGMLPTDQPWPPNRQP